MKNWTVLLAAVLAAPVLAAGGEWQQEPRAVFGVRLGQPLDASGIPACPARDYSRGIPPAPATLCIDRTTDPTFASVLATPDVGFVHDTALRLQGGTVAVIELRFENSQFNQVLDLLTERYGAPAASSVTTATSRAGASVPSRVVVWNGPRTRIVLQEHTVRMDRGTVYVSDVAMQAQAAQAAKDAAKRGAGNL